MDKYKNLYQYIFSNKKNKINYILDINLSGHRGLVTLEDISENSIIFSIQEDSIINKNNFFELPKYHLYKKDISEPTLFALYLYYNSYKIKEYIDFLPDDINNFAYSQYLLLSKEQQELLKNTYTGKQLIKYNNVEVLDDINTCKNYLPEFNDKEKFEKLVKLKILVLSRLFLYTRSKLGLVFFVDLLNHNNNNNCSWTYDNLNNNFQIISNRNIAKGEELYINYGNKSNLENYLIYGFISNPKINDLYISINNLEFNLKSTKEEFLYNIKNKNKSYWHNKIDNISKLINNNLDNNLIKLLEFEKDILIYLTQFLPS
jgi:hypothetical protein